MPHVLIDEVQATVTRHEGGNLLAVFDELSAHALTDGGVGLLRLNAAAIMWGNRHHTSQQEPEPMQGLPRGLLLAATGRLRHVAHIFSSTMPLQCEEPPKGLHLNCVPRCAFL